VRLKLDENLGLRTARTFAEAGHDVATVAGQGLAGFADVDVLAVCVAEQRALVTLDLDFANPFRFDPSPTAGIAVLRMPDLPGRSDLVTAATLLVKAMEQEAMSGQL
jgi:predicted nuclease of predicted toxin-antitoxin system